MPPHDPAGNSDRALVTAAIAGWFGFWAGLLLWSNLDTGTSPLDEWPSAVTFPLFGILPQLALGLITGRSWTALCPLALMVVVSGVVALSWDESDEGPIGVAVLWVLAFPASIAVLTGVLLRRLAVRRERRA